MPDGAFRIRERDGDDRHRRNAGAGAGQRRVEAADDRRRDARRGRQQHRVGDHRLAAGQVQAVTETADGLQAVDTNAGPQRMARQRGDQRVHHFREAAQGRDKRRRRRAGASLRARPESADQAAVRSFHLEEPWKQRLHREAGRIAAVNAGQQRIGEILHRFAAEATAHERSDRFVGGSRPSGQDIFRGHAKFSAQREGARGDERRPVGRDAEHRRLGQRAQRAPANEKRAPVRLRTQPMADPQFPAEFDGRGLLRQQRVGAGVDDEPAGALGLDDAAEGGRRFEQQERHAAARELVGGRQAAHTAADDRDGRAGHVRRPARRRGRGLRPRSAAGPPRAPPRVRG